MSVVLAMALTFSLASAAFAAPGPNGPIKGDEKHPAEAAITKILELPVDTQTPAASFEFTVTPYEVDGSQLADDLTAMPEIGVNGKITIGLSATVTEETSNGIKRIIMESDNIFKGITWTHTGEYKYRVTEIPDTYTCNTSNPIEYMSYSKAEYEVGAYVNRGSDGSFYVEYVSAVVITPGAPGQKGDEKVDPTPGGDPDIEGDYSQMIFINSYLKIATPENPDPATDAVLTISKTVTGGELADHEEYFNFDVTIASPEIAANPTKTHRAYVVDAQGIVSPLPATQAPAGTIKSDGTYDYIEFTSETAARIQLKDGQKLSFIDLPVGSSFTVQEVNPKNYTPSYDLKINGEFVEGKDAAAGMTLGLSKTYHLGEKENSVAYTNTYREVTPMGIAVDNLPYLVMAALALLGLIAFVAVRAHRKPHDQA